MEEISSEILIKCKKNDLEAYRLVVRHYRSFVISLLYRFLGGKYAEEVEDFAREIFIRLYDFMKKYDADRGIKFSVCVFTVVKNYCYNELSIKRLQVDPVAENKPSAGEAPEDEVLAGELKQRVEKCIETLPDGQRMIFILKQYEGFSYEEIAGLMNLPAGLVKTKLNRAKIKLKDLLWPYLKEDHGKTV